MNKVVVPMLDLKPIVCSIKLGISYLCSPSGFVFNDWKTERALREPELVIIGLGLHFDLATLCLVVKGLKPAIPPPNWLLLAPLSQQLLYPTNRHVTLRSELEKVESLWLEHEEVIRSSKLDHKHATWLHSYSQLASWCDYDYRQHRQISSDLYSQKMA